MAALLGLAIASKSPAQPPPPSSSPPEEARRELADRLRADPANEELNMTYGLQCLAMERCSHAILAFQRVLLLNPANDRARLELARACFLLGQLDESRLQFERVLDGDPPPAVRRNIEAYLNAIGRRQPGWRFTGRVETGVLYDDNVNYGPSSQIIGIAPVEIGTLWVDQLQLAPESVRESAWGAFAAGTLLFSRQPREGRPLSFGGYGRIEANALEGASDYNLFTVQSGAGPRWQWERLAFDLPLRVEYLARGGSTLATVAGLAPGCHRQLTPRLALSLSANLDFRDYADSSDRDGAFAALGLQTSLALGQRSRLLGGARVLREEPDAAIWRNTGGEAFLGAMTRPLDRLTCFGNASFRVSEYDEREPLAPRDRRDEQAVFTAGASWLFPGGWGLNLQAQCTLCDSTFDLYEYDRVATKWSLSHDF